MKICSSDESAYFVVATRSRRVILDFTRSAAKIEKSNKNFSYFGFRRKKQQTKAISSMLVFAETFHV
jgi:hypothetical protein